jgi:Concanavalin A-like lectin/glucanases superfamily
MKSTNVITKLLIGGGLVLLFAFTLVGQATAQICVQPPSGLVSWWPGDGNTNDIADGNNGTLSGGATFAQGEVGQAFDFNSSGAEVLVPHNANQNPGAQISVDAWIYIPNPLVGFTTASIINKRSPGNNEGYTFELVNGFAGDARNNFQPVNNGLQFEITTPNGSFVNAITASNVIGSGQWYFVAGTYDGSAVKVFVNGSLVASKSITGSIDPVSDDLVIGRNIVNGLSFPGLIDEVELFNRALSATEIQAIYLASTKGKCKAPSLTRSLSAQVQALVDAGTLNQGQGNSLTTRLAQVLNSLNKGQTKTACNQLQSFINAVSSLVSNGVLTPAQGQPLIDAATDIRTTIGC